MGRGKPISVKCPKCKRGKYLCERQVRGVMVIAHETRVSARKSSCGGTGGARFYGHRGIVECLDCGHTWRSTLAGVNAWRKLLPLAER